jgi:hypothetical protein
MMTDKEFVIQQICDVDRTADPRFLETRTEAELDEYYRYLTNLERVKSIANTN